MPEKLRTAYEVANDRYSSPEATDADAEPAATSVPSPRVSPENNLAATPDVATATPELTTSPDTETPSTAEVFYTDVEILGKHYPVRQMIKEIGNQRVKAVESASANWKNLLDTPGKMRLGLSRSIAESRLTRQQRKAEAVAHLSDKNLLKRRRIRKLHKAQERFRNADVKYRGRKDRMTKRKEDVGTNVEQRRAKYRNELRIRREAALGRRALRHELRTQGAGRLEARAVLKDVPQEHLERVSKLATTAYASERRAAQADKQKSKAITHENRTLSTIDDNRRRRGEAANEAKEADDIVIELRTEAIPKAKERLEALQKELDDYDGDSDEARTDLQVQIQETEESIRRNELREIPYWEQVAFSNRQRVVTLDEKHTELTANLGQNTAAKNTALADADSARATADAHKAELTKAAEEATNSGPEN